MQSIILGPFLQPSNPEPRYGRLRNLNGVMPEMSSLPYAERHCGADPGAWIHPLTSDVIQPEGTRQLRTNTRITCIPKPLFPRLSVRIKGAGVYELYLLGSMRTLMSSDTPNIAL